jgi:hypothetical protein
MMASNAVVATSIIIGPARAMNATIESMDEKIPPRIGNRLKQKPDSLDMNLFRLNSARLRRRKLNVRRSDKNKTVAITLKTTFEVPIKPLEAQRPRRLGVIALSAG